MCNNSQAIAICSCAWIWHYVGHVFELVYNYSDLFDIVKGRQLMMYLLDKCVSCSTHLAIFMAHEGSREVLNFPIIVT